MLAALGLFLQVVVAVGAFADDAGLGGEVEDATQASAAALGAVEVSGAASGVARHWHQAGGGGEVPCIGAGAQIAGCDEELGAQEGAHAWQGLDDVGLRVGVEGPADLLVDVLEPVVQDEELRHDVRDDFGSDILAGQYHVLSAGGLKRGGDGRVGVADAASLEPDSEMGLAVTKYGCRGLP